MFFTIFSMCTYVYAVQNHLSAFWGETHFLFSLLRNDLVISLFFQIRSIETKEALSPFGGEGLRAFVAIHTSHGTPGRCHQT